MTDSKLGNSFIENDVMSLGKRIHYPRSSASGRSNPLRNVVGVAVVRLARQSLNVYCNLLLLNREYLLLVIYLELDFFHFFQL